MRIRIVHQTLYRYDAPAAGVTQILRLTPRNHEGQYVVDWRIDLSADCRLDCHEDAFGNITHSFTAEGPLTELSIHAEGEVETHDTQGVVRGSIERFPPTLFLRETALTAPDSAIRDFARSMQDRSDGDVLNLLHGLLRHVHEAVALDTDPAQEAGSAAEAFRLKRGVCQDLTHIFIAAARCLGIPTRYAGGYLNRTHTADRQAPHAWAEAFVPGLGWVGFDPAHGACPTDAHVRVAVGLDRLGATPIRGIHYGGSGEKMAVALQVAQTGHVAYQRQQ
jgi:transglutaminase-like putative cysteine protease